LSITTCRLVEKLPAAPLEEEAARSGERTSVVKGRDPDGGQQQRLNHGSLCSYRKQFAFCPCAVQEELLFKREKGRGRRAKIHGPKAEKPSNTDDSPALLSYYHY